MASVWEESTSRHQHRSTRAPHTPTLLVAPTQNARYAAEGSMPLRLRNDRICSNCRRSKAALVLKTQPPRGGYELVYNVEGPVAG